MIYNCKRKRRANICIALDSAGPTSASKLALIRALMSAPGANVRRPGEPSERSPGRGWNTLMSVAMQRPSDTSEQKLVAPLKPLQRSRAHTHAHTDRQTHTRTHAHTHCVCLTCATCSISPQISALLVLSIGSNGGDDDDDCKNAAWHMCAVREPTRSYLSSPAQQSRLSFPVLNKQPARTSSTQRLCECVCLCVFYAAPATILVQSLALSLSLFFPRPVDLPGR